MAKDQAVELKENEIAVDKEKLQGILERLGELEKKNQRNEMKVAKPVNEKTCTVLYYEDSPVMAFGKFSKKFNDMKEEVLYIDLTLGNGKNVTVPYIELLRDGARKFARIKDIKMDIQTKEIIDSMTQIPQTIEKKFVDNYRTVGMGVKVPVVVETVYRTYVVEVEETGEVLTLDESVINA